MQIDVEIYCGVASPLILINDTSYTSEASGGMFLLGTPVDPYAITGGITILRLSPTHMPLKEIKTS